MKSLATLLLCGLWAGSATAQAASVGDPTRPPASFLDGASAAIDEGGLRLQSVLSPRSGKATAIISGQMVRVGERIGEARLVRLSETEAVLRGPRGVERLFLTPEVNKTSGTSKPVATLREKKEKP